MKKNESWGDILGTAIGEALAIWLGAFLISVSVHHLFHYPLGIAWTMLLISGIRIASKSSK